MIMELTIVLLGLGATFFCPVHGYVATCEGSGPSYVTEEVRSTTCNTSAYQSLYYMENWGQGRYYTDENKVVDNAYGENAIMLGKISSIYEQNMTKTYSKNCRLTQKKFILEIQLTCVLRNYTIDDPFPNPVILRHDCPFQGIKESDDVIFIPGSVSHHCSRINQGPCLPEEGGRWGFGQITLFKRGPSVMEKLLKVCGLHPQLPEDVNTDLCPEVTATVDNCESGSRMLTSVAAIYVLSMSVVSLSL